MGRLVDLDDLLDAAGVADVIGLGSPNSVATYRERYTDFPPPAWMADSGRCQLWVRADIEEWAANRG